MMLADGFHLTRQFPLTLRDEIFILANFGIFLGYLFLATMVIPHMKVRLWRTRIGGVFFFLTCGFTHLELGLHAYFNGQIAPDDMFSIHMFVIHTFQFASVWFFVTGLYIEFVRDGRWPKSDRALK